MILIQEALIKQLLVAGAASLGYLTIGLVRGFSSPAVPSMEDISPHLVPDDEAISWISAVPPLGACMGSLAAGPLLQWLGRRGALLTGSPLFALSWLAISFSRTPLKLILSRAATGFSVGILLPSAQVYVSECSQPQIRGRLGSLPALFMAAGILLVYSGGARLDWDRLALLSSVFPCILFFILLLLPESPVWLAARGRSPQAAKAAAWLHQPIKIAQVKLETVEGIKTGVACLEAKPQASTASKKPLFEGPYAPQVLFTKPVLVPFGLVLAIQIFQQCSGIDTIVFYTVSIFQASGTSLDEYQATIIVGAVQLLATGLSLFLIDKTGRRVLLLWSGVVMSASMGLLTWYFYLHARGKAGGLGLIPLLGQIAFISGYSIGYSNIPYILMGELLPYRQRGFLSSFSGAVNLGTMFLVIKTYPEMSKAIGTEGAFACYAVFCLLSCLFVVFLLPETKGKSLEEIEMIFSKKKQSEMTKS